jgi:thiamine kinase-like enzyme
MSSSLEATLARVPLWKGKTLTISPLTGGITNRNYRVEVDGQAFVLRLAGAKTSLLGIDRANEHAATHAAASVGIGPEVIYFIEPEGYLVTRFINGQPIPPDEMRQPDNLRRVAGVLRRIHALPPIPGTFSPFRIVEDYDRIAREQGVASFPENYGWLRARMAEVENAFLKEPFVPCLCHDDFLNENFLAEEPGGAIRILDWEYAGMGDLFFDLANFSVNHGLRDDDDRLLLEAYFGDVTPRRFARQKLMRIMSDFREAMWGVVQQGLSSLDFDFRAYADKHFARMTQNFSDPRYAGWLAQFE